MEGYADNQDRPEGEGYPDGSPEEEKVEGAWDAPGGPAEDALDDTDEDDEDEDDEDLEDPEEDDEDDEDDEAIALKKFEEDGPQRP